MKVSIISESIDEIDWMYTWIGEVSTRGINKMLEEVVCIEQKTVKDLDRPTNTK